MQGLTIQNRYTFGILDTELFLFLNTGELKLHQTYNKKTCSGYISVLAWELLHFKPNVTILVLLDLQKM